MGNQVRPFPLPNDTTHAKLRWLADRIDKLQESVTTLTAMSIGGLPNEDFRKSLAEFMGKHGFKRSTGAGPCDDPTCACKSSEAPEQAPDPHQLCLHGTPAIECPICKESAK